MSEPDLAPTPALPDAPHAVAAWTVTETPLALASYALSRGAEDGFADALRRSFGIGLPPPGQAREAGATSVLRLGADHGLLVLADGTIQPAGALVPGLEGSAWLTDQSDVWVALVLTGPDPRRALELLCPLDLEDAAFPPGSATRTAMAHMAAILWRRAECWVFLTPRSSASDFAAHLTGVLRMGAGGAAPGPA